LWETFRACTSVLVTPGSTGAASKSKGSLSVIISGASTSSATPCPTSPTPTSSGVLADHLRVPSPQDRSQEPKDNEGATHNIATRHASGEEVVRAIIDRNKGKAKRGDTTIGEGGSDCFQKKETGRCPGACSSSRLSAWADDPPTAIYPTSLKRSSREHS